MRVLPTLERVHEAVEYDCETGVFVWKTKISNKTVVGKVAGCKRNCSTKSYWHLQIDGCLLDAHRLAWFYVYGEWPNIIDHIDGDGLNNRISNLRSVTRSENARNCRRASNNKSGCTGVFMCNGLWYAVIKMNKKTKKLGVFKKIEDAIAARKAAEKKYGFHENHGREPKCDTSSAG